MEELKKLVKINEFSSTGGPDDALSNLKNFQTDSNFPFKIGKPDNTEKNKSKLIIYLNSNIKKKFITILLYIINLKKEKLLFMIR